jgi:GR25 family glycosyltransferase involved in LPS biosynthesis
MLKVFIISLPEKENLKDKMSNVKEYFGTNFSFYNGVRLTEGEFKNMVINNEISPFYSGGRKDIKELIGENGAWKAHRNLWKFIVDNKIKKSFIMEDGSIFDEIAFEQQLSNPTVNYTADDERFAHWFLAVGDIESPDMLEKRHEGST